MLKAAASGASRARGRATSTCEWKRSLRRAVCSNLVLGVVLRSLLFFEVLASTGGGAQAFIGVLLCGLQGARCEGVSSLRGSRETHSFCSKASVKHLSKEIP